MADSLTLSTAQIASLAITVTLGIYLSNARLTVTGWKFQSGVTKEKREELNKQLNQLLNMLYLIIAIGGLALADVVCRALGGTNECFVFDGLLIVGWAALLIWFVVFHYKIEDRKQDRKVIFNEQAGADTARLSPEDKLAIVLQQTGESFTILSQKFSELNAEFKGRKSPTESGTLFS